MNYTPLENLIIGLVLLSLSGLILFLYPWNSQKEDSVAEIRPKETVLPKASIQILTMKMSSDKYGIVVVSGNALFHKNCPFASVTFQLLNGSKYVIGNAFDHVMNMKSGQTWQYEAKAFIPSGSKALSATYVTSCY